MLDAAFLAPVNHLLAGEGWARKRLQRHAGRCARVRVPPFSFEFVITDEGYLESVAGDTRPDAELFVSPFLLPRIAVGDESALRDVRTHGDVDLASTLAHLVRNLRWDAEEDLSRVVGDIAAHRIVSAGSALARWPAHAADSFGRNLGEYLSEERHVIAGPAVVRDFAHSVDALRDDVERLEKRMERLERKLRNA